MDKAREADYLRMARDNPMMRCSEVPKEVLEVANYDHTDPTEFVRAFLEKGYTAWANQVFGPVPMSRAQIDNGVMALWLRTSRLYTSHVLGRPDPDWDKPFFSDEGLFD